MNKRLHVFLSYSYKNVYDNDLYWRYRKTRIDYESRFYIGQYRSNIFYHNIGKYYHDEIITFEECPLNFYIFKKEYNVIELIHENYYGKYYPSDDEYDYEQRLSLFKIFKRQCLIKQILED